MKYPPPEVLDALMTALALAAAIYIFTHLPPEKHEPPRKQPVSWHWEGCWQHVLAKPFSQDERDFDCAV